MLKEYTAIDHNYFEFDVKEKLSEPHEVKPNDHIKWAYRKLNLGALIQKINEGPPLPPAGISTNDMAKALHEYLITLCDLCMPKRTDRANKHRPAH